MPPLCIHSGVKIQTKGPWDGGTPCLLGMKITLILLPFRGVFEIFRWAPPALYGRGFAVRPQKRFRSEILENSPSIKIVNVLASTGNDKSVFSIILVMVCLAHCLFYFSVLSVESRVSRDDVKNNGIANRYATLAKPSTNAVRRCK